MKKMDSLFSSQQRNFTIHRRNQHFAFTNRRYAADESVGNFVFPDCFTAAPVNGADHSGVGGDIKDVVGFDQCGGGDFVG